MLVDNQIVETKWSGRTKDWYTNKGYVFTKCGDPLFVRVTDLPCNSSVKIKCECDICGYIYTMTYQSYTRALGSSNATFLCEKCRQQMYFSRFITYCNERGYIPVSVLSDYKGKRTKLKYICPKHGLHEVTYDNAMQGAGCQECGRDAVAKKLITKTGDLIQIIEGKNGNKLLNPEEYINAQTINLKIRCGRCGNIFISSLNRIQYNEGACSKCGREKTRKKNTFDIKYVKGIIESRNSNLLLNPEEYVNQRTNNLNILCGSCGGVFTTSLASYKSSLVTGCPRCNEISYGEYLISKFLDKNHIRYTRQQKFSDCRDKQQLPFDFYIQDYNLCIEFDGHHHYAPIWGEDHFITTLLHDGMKDNYCRWHNIDLLRIPYWERENIDDILQQKLNLVA